MLLSLKSKIDKKPFIDKNTFKTALKSSAPIIFGYIPTGFIFGVLLVSSGYSPWLALIMSMFIYAGAGQYLAVGLLAGGSNFLDIALMTFLINSKHLFYGLSLIEPFKKFNKLKLYMIFSLTDETYAVLTNPKEISGINKKAYMFLVAFINHLSWITGSVLGAVFSNVIKFDTKGMDFAMTALFIVIVVEQFKSYKTKMPFIIGTSSALFICLFVSKNQILLFGTIISVILLIILRKKIDENVDR